jgi:hypothetical protein
MNQQSAGPCSGSGPLTGTDESRTTETACDEIQRYSQLEVMAYLEGREIRCYSEGTFFLTDNYWASAPAFVLPTILSG